MHFLSESSLAQTDVDGCLAEFAPYPELGGNARNGLKGSMLIDNVVIYTGLPGADEYLLGEDAGDWDVLIVNGIIVAIGPNLEAPPGVPVINGGGRFLTPGIVDLHSHLGIDGWPALWANGDGNESTDPITSYVRALDGFNPDDIGLEHVRAGGITTAQILPGSANMMGGEAFYIKTLTSHDVTDQMIDAPFRAMKMACGENPKRSYGLNRGEMPRSRMGAAWLMREMFDEARQMDRAQREWCADLVDTGRMNGHFPYDLRLDSLIALYRRQLKLNVHCYQSHDLTMILRLADEFDFEVSAFHHSLETYQIADRLAERNITSALFTDRWGSKFEAYDASPWASKILDDAGVPVVIKSDHPVIDSFTLMYEAARAVHYDLPKNKAMAAVTHLPARAMGISHWLGSIELGLDGDIVIWDRDPLTVGAITTQVVINGIMQHENAAAAKAAAKSKHKTHNELAAHAASVKRICTEESPCKIRADDEEEDLPSYIVRAGLIRIPGGDDIVDGMIVVENGIIRCAGISEICEGVGGKKKIKKKEKKKQRSAVLPTLVFPLFVVYLSLSISLPLICSCSTVLNF